MKERMSRWGVGPTFASLSLIYGMIMLAINHYYYPAFRIPFVPNWLLSITGIALIVIGVPFFIISVITVSKATRLIPWSLKVFSDVVAIPYTALGWFSLCLANIPPGRQLDRIDHPLFYDFLLNKLVTREEIYLEQRFGSEYLV